MERVFLSSPTNSQMFTACCSTAICHDQARCPRCGNEVYPGEGYADHERDRMRWRMAFRRPHARD